MPGIVYELVSLSHSCQDLVFVGQVEQGTVMSNFEPNAVIRGFQLTVVGSMSLTLHGQAPSEYS